VIDYLPNARILESDFDNPRTKYQRRDNAMGSSSPLNLEGLIAPGDSGGGLFINVGGTNYLAGINSFIGSFDGKTNADYGDISGAIRVSAFNSWIDSVLSGPVPRTVSLTVVTGANATDLMAAGVYSVPEPASGALLLTIMLTGLACRRR
jgi:succinyl-CoA synthetase beta subunit